ncbi:gamma-butyrobetaine hydroxylase-like domain-containing protein [Conchiformibius kuhniae]|uniref:Gamma-butyrobetaine hydroxylase-like domain-containing protein n=1 Tax=Conchiformibius kuhniae TaxID=211502 RepID=A0A8T9MTM6_9NEIS|nr:DUF971 domain-containing protein [Conchiformibius kuhniae]UOP04444.1 DUF971 domain-containing protein [Conchiformibius kuhniae]
MTATPTEIRLQNEGRTLLLRYDHAEYALSAEYLRVYSPSAEVRGHGKPVLQLNKQDVTITALAPVGHYALKIAFSDGHDSGLYDWAYLHRLATERETLWQDYLARAAAHYQKENL